MAHYSGILSNNLSLIRDLIGRSGYGHIYEFKDGFIIGSDSIKKLPIVRGRITDVEATNLRPYYKNKRSFAKDGKWSIVDLDEKERRLYLIRDILGISPLYYFLASGIFGFSTSLEGLLELKATRVLDNELAADFLLRGKMDHCDKTLLNDVYEVQQAECLEVDINTLAVSGYQYFEPVFSSPTGSSDYQSVVSSNASAVRCRINASVSGENEVVFLSGGLDSSVIASCLANKRSSSLNAYTVSYPEMPSIDETSWAQKVIYKHPSLDWKTIEVNGNDFVRDIEDMHRLIEFPTLSAGTYNQFKLFKVCRDNGMSHAWDGLGADAIYGGHDHYRHLLFVELVGVLKFRAAQEVLEWKGSAAGELSAIMKSSIKYWGLNQRWLASTIQNYKQDLKIYNPDFLERNISQLQEQNVRKENGLKQVMARDFFGSGVRHLSRFSDRLAAGFGVDVHYPFAENVSWAQELFKLPTEMHFKDGRSKSILRDSFQDVLPSEIYTRQDKKGMQSPNNQWLSDHKENWVQYFDKSYGDVYDVSYIHANYKKWIDVAHHSENYKLFKHVSFAVWRKVYDV